jgi:hypothetical protein
MITDTVTVLGRYADGNGNATILLQKYKFLERNVNAKAYPFLIVKSPLICSLFRIVIPPSFIPRKG